MLGDFALFMTTDLSLYISHCTRAKCLFQLNEPTLFAQSSMKMVFCQLFCFLEALDKVAFFITYMIFLIFFTPKALVHGIEPNPWIGYCVIYQTGLLNFHVGMGDFFVNKIVVVIDSWTSSQWRLYWAFVSFWLSWPLELMVSILIMLGTKSRFL